MSVGETSGDGFIASNGSDAGAAAEDPRMAKARPVSERAMQALAENLANSPIYLLCPDVLWLILKELPAGTIRELSQISKLFRDVILMTPELNARRRLDVYVSGAKHFAFDKGNIILLCRLANIQRDEECVVLARKAFEAMFAPGGSKHGERKELRKELTAIKPLELNLGLGSERLVRMQHFSSFFTGIIFGLFRNPLHLFSDCEDIRREHGQELLQFQLDRIHAKSFTNRPKAIQTALSIKNIQKRDEALLEIVKVKLDQELGLALKEVDLITNPYIKVKALTEIAKLYKSPETLKKAKDLLFITDNPKDLTDSGRDALFEIFNTEFIIDYPSAVKNEHECYPYFEKMDSLRIQKMGSLHGRPYKDCFFNRVKKKVAFLHDRELLENKIKIEILDILNSIDSKLFDQINKIKNSILETDNVCNERHKIAVSDSERNEAVRKIGEFADIFTEIRRCICFDDRENILKFIGDAFSLFEKHHSFFKNIYSDLISIILYPELNDFFYKYVVFDLMEIYSWTHDPKDLAFARALVAVVPDPYMKAKFFFKIAETALLHENVSENQEVKMIEELIPNLTNEQKPKILMDFIELVAGNIPERLRWKK